MAIARCTQAAAHVTGLVANLISFRGRDWSSPDLSKKIEWEELNQTVEDHIQKQAHNGILRGVREFPCFLAVWRAFDS